VEDIEPRRSLDLPADDSDDPRARAQHPNLPERIAFAIHAVRRRKRLAACIFLSGVLASTAFYLMRTRIYHVETKILAQKQQPFPSVVRPIDDVPTRSASDLIHRRENLVAILKTTGLYTEGQPARLPWYRRALRLVVPAAPRDDDPLNAIVMRLDKALIVTAGEGTLTIEIDWSSPQQAYRLVEAALQNFLEARQQQEITTIEDVVTQLQSRAATLRQQLDEVVQQAQREPARGAPASHAGASPSRAAIPQARRVSAEEMARLRSQLERKQRTIRDMEEFQRRRLADLQAQLDALAAEVADVLAQDVVAAGNS
jgi:hypothetical protein